VATSTTGGATPVPFLSGSNPQLKPETSTTGTMGLVYSPHQLQGLNFTLDYYRITVKGIIGSVSANDILDGCYVQGDPDLCARFSRNANGSIAYLNESLANIGTLKTEGYDFGAHYRLPQLAYGQFVLGLDSSYLRKYDLRSSVNAPVEGLAGFVSGTGGLFRLRANASLGWSLGNYSASWTARYYSGLRDSCLDSTTECNSPNYTNPWIGSIGDNNKGAVVFNDVQFGYKLPWRATVSVGVNNLFGKQGPLNYSAGANGSTAYLPSFDIDRYYYLSYTQKF
jgi:iron complex outermembrane receptor protein